MRWHAWSQVARLQALVALLPSVHAWHALPGPCWEGGKAKLSPTLMVDVTAGQWVTYVLVLTSSRQQKPAPSSKAAALLRPRLQLQCQCLWDILQHCCAQDVRFSVCFRPLRACWRRKGVLGRAASSDHCRHTADQATLFNASRALLPGVANKRWLAVCKVLKPFFL